jgi:hypothetical protein
LTAMSQLVRPDAAHRETFLAGMAEFSPNDRT